MTTRRHPPQPRSGARRGAPARDGQPPRVPGYRIGSPVGFGSNGPVWGAVAAGGGAGEGSEVALTILAAVEGERADARRRRLAALLTARHRNHAWVRDVVRLPGGEDVVVTERVEGPTLAALRAARPALGGSEAAGLTRALGHALAALHRLGVIHGDVSPANVVIRPDGTPVLLDLAGEAGFESGTQGFRPPEVVAGGPPSPAGDVWSAAATVLWLVEPTQRDAVAAALAPASQPDPAVRCGPDQLVQLAGRIAEPGTIAQPGAAALAGGAVRARAEVEITRIAGGRGRPGSRRRRWRESRSAGREPRPARRREPRSAGGRSSGHGRLTPGLAVVSVVLGLLGGAGMAALLVQAGAGDMISGWARRAEPPEALEAVVTSLLAARDAALVAGDPGALAAVSVPGSPAAQADARMLDGLAAAQVDVLGLETSLVDLDVLHRQPVAAEVAVTTRQGAHLRDGPDGQVRVPAQPDRCVLLALELRDEDWLVRETRPCPGAVS